MSLAAETRRIWSPELESIRGIAIALVVLFHASELLTHRAFPPISVTLWEAFILGGHTGVTLFFVLSGFLLTPAFLAEASGGREVRRGIYFAHRARRILPVYFLFIALGSVFTASTPADILHGVPYLVFLNAVPGVATPLTPWSDVWWSLATEAQFYVLLPLMAFLGRGGCGRRALLLLLAAYLVSYTAANLGLAANLRPSDRVLLFASVFGRGPAFALGALAAVAAPMLRRACAQASPRWRGLGPDLALALALLALGILLQRVVLTGYVAAELRWNWWHGLEALLWSSVVLLLVASPLRVKPLLCNRPLGALGRWSYSLYLIHFPVLWFAFAAPGTPERSLGFAQLGLGGLVIAGCVVASAFSYRFVEQPFLGSTK